MILAIHAGLEDSSSAPAFADIHRSALPHAGENGSSRFWQTLILFRTHQFDLIPSPSAGCAFVDDYVDSSLPRSTHLSSTSAIQMAKRLAVVG
jgi:hypothetical protein